jgi:hypothetical protein
MQTANFFYHDGHPSTAAHRAVGDMLYREAIAKPSRHQEMRAFRGTPYAREATKKTPPNMSVSAK